MSFVFLPLSRRPVPSRRLRRNRPEAGSRHDGFPTPRNHENVSYALPFAVCPLPRNGEGGRGEGGPRRIEHTSLSPGRPARTAGRAAGREGKSRCAPAAPPPAPPRSGAGSQGLKIHGQRARRHPFSEQRGPGGEAGASAYSPSYLHNALRSSSVSGYGVVSGRWRWIASFTVGMIPYSSGRRAAKIISRQPFRCSGNTPQRYTV